MPRGGSEAVRTYSQVSLTSDAVVLLAEWMSRSSIASAHRTITTCPCAGGQSISGGGAYSECWVRTCCAGVLIYPSPTSLRKTSCPVCGHCTSTRNWAEVISVAWRGTAPRIQPAASAHDAFTFQCSDAGRRGGGGSPMPSASLYGWMASIVGVRTCPTRVL